MSSSDTIIDTTHGPLPASELEKREGVLDDEHERTTWVEYWLGEELVHRSAHVTLKKWPAGMDGLAAIFGSQE